MSVVFTDSFVVAADANIDAYPSGSPDYAYISSSGAQIFVFAPEDKVYFTGGDSIGVARIIDAAVPTGDQQITCTVSANGTDDNSSFGVVRATSGWNGYIGSINVNSGNDTGLYRVDNGSFTLLASAENGLSAGNHTMRLKATGAGATISLELQINATTTITYGDTHANRKTSGPPGIGAYTIANLGNTLDDVSVEDFPGAGGSQAKLLSGKLSLSGKL